MDIYIYSMIMQHNGCINGSCGIYASVLCFFFLDLHGTHELKQTDVR